MKKMFVILFLTVTIPSSSWALEIYHSKFKTGIRSYDTKYGISNSWLVECTEQVSGRGTLVQEAKFN